MFAWAARHAALSAAEQRRVNTGEAAVSGPFYIHHREQPGLTMRLVRSLHYLDLQAQPIGPASVRDMTETQLSRACTALVGDTFSAATTAGVASAMVHYPLHLQFRLRALEISLLPNTGPRTFWVTLPLELHIVGADAAVFDQLLYQIQQRYSDDGYLDELGSDHDLQGVTWITRIELHLLLDVTQFGGGGRSKGNRLTWQQSAGGERHYHTLELHSENNECGIVAFNWEAQRRGHTVLPADFFRRRMLHHGHPLITTYELQIVSNHYKINYIVFSLQNESPVFRHDAHQGETLRLLLKDGHYSVIMEAASTCVCGKRDSAQHKCLSKNNFCEKCCVTFDSSHICPYSAERQAVLRAQDQEARRLEQQLEKLRVQTARAIDDVSTPPALLEKVRVFHEIVFQDNNSCFLMGPGGTGKTKIGLSASLEIAAKLDVKCAVVCPTGQASTLTEGATTIHFLFKILPGLDNRPETLMHRMTDEEREYFSTLQKLFLDEFSMIDAHLMTTVDMALRRLKNAMFTPFGGVKIIAIGDPLQLSPVEGNAFFWECDAIHNLLARDEMGIVYLDEPVRYPDLEWYGLLGRARVGKPTDADISKLLRRLKTLENWQTEMRWDVQSMPVMAVVTRKAAEKFNKECMQHLSATRKVYKIRAALHEKELQKIQQGNSTEAKAWKEVQKVCESDLELCVDCKVMLLVNTSGNQKYLKDYNIGNGSVGFIRHVDSDSIAVYFSTIKSEVRIRRHAYDTLCTQYPLRVCYASTIHKLQGASLDDLILDLRGCFTDHQGYVGLSRVKEYEKLYLVGREKLTGPDIKRFLQRVNPRSLMFSAKNVHKPLPMPALNDLGEVVHDLRELAPAMSMRIRRHVKNHRNFECKSIFFDAETCHLMGQLSVYHMQVLKVAKGCFTSKAMTRMREEQNIMVEFCEYIMNTVLYDVAQYEKFKTMSALREWYSKPWVLCAYNGANFDFHFLIRYLFTDSPRRFQAEYKVNQMWRGKTLTYFDLVHRVSGKKCLVFHDLCRFLMCPLSKASKDLLGVNDKGVFPHKHINRCGWESVLQSRQPRVCVRDDFYPKDWKALDALASLSWEERWDVMDNVCNICVRDGKVLSITLNLQAQLEEYAAMDVLVLYRIYEKIDGLVRDTMDNASVLDFYSSNQMSKYGALRHLPVEARLPLAPGGNSKTIDSFLFTLDPEQDVWVSEAMFGGRTFPRQTAHVSPHAAFTTENPTITFTPENAYEDVMRFLDTHDSLVMVDIVSMYVAIMKDYTFPYGPPKFFTPEQTLAWNTLLVSCLDSVKISGELLDHQHGFVILDITIEGHPADVEPPVPYRTDTGRTLWDSKTRRGKYTHVDVALLLRAGGRVHTVHGGIRWPRQAKLFADYMKLTLQWKQEGEDTGNEALRSFGKLCGNTVYGGMCMRTFLNSMAMCYSDQDMHQFLESNEWQGAYDYSGGIMIWGKRKSSDTVYSPTAKQIGAYVLSYSRLIVDNFVNAINPARMELIRCCVENARDEPNEAQLENLQRLRTEAILKQPFYGDTDSLLIHASQVRPAYEGGFMADEVGKWTCDLNKRWHHHFDLAPCSWLVPLPGLIFEYYGPAPKSYAMRYTLPEVTYCELTNAYTVTYPMQNMREKVRFKGIPKGVPIRFQNATHDTLDFAFFKRVVFSLQDPEGDCEEEVERAEATIESIGKVGYSANAADILSGLSPFSLKPVLLTRSLFKTAFTGRKIEMARPVADDGAEFIYNNVLTPWSFTGSNSFEDNIL